MKPSKVQELLADPSKVYMITMTSVQKIYGSHIKNIKIDMDNEVVEFDDNGLHFVIDMTDINGIIMNPDNLKINGLSIP